MRINELKKELERVAEKYELLLATIKDAENPQTVKIKEKYEANIEVLRAVLARIEGDRIALDLL